MTPSEVAARYNVAKLFIDAIAVRGRTYAEMGIRGSTISNLIHGTGDLKLTTLVRVADALDCDVVVTLRRRT